jgi:hypothetical protein
LAEKARGRAAFANVQIPPVPEGARDWTPYRAQAGSLSIRMAANCRVTLKLGPMTLEAGASPDEVYVDQPVPDSLGQ